MGPDIAHILTYLKVVEAGSFTKAADQLRLSKSVISKHIDALEQALQCQLLQRSTRKLVVTEAGAHFYQALQHLPSQIQSAQEEVNSHASDVKGVLKVIAPANFESSLKQSVVPQFLQLYPKVTLKLQFVQQPQDYINSEFDIIIMWKVNLKPFPDYALITKKLFTMPVGIYASPEYLQQHGIPKTPDDLLKHNCFSTAGNQWPFTLPDGTVKYLNLSGNLQTESEEIIHHAAANNIGIAYSYPFAFQESLRSGKVVKILSDYTQFMVDLHLFYHPTAFLPKKMSCFISVILEHYHAMQEEILSRGDH